MNNIAEEVLDAASQMDQRNLVPIQRIMFHELQEQLRCALDKITDLNIRISCQADEIDDLKKLNQKTT